MSCWSRRGRRICWLQRHRATRCCLGSSAANSGGQVAQHALLAEVLGMGQKAVGRTLDLGEPQCKEAAKAWWARGMVVTSSYSGVGTFEMGVADALQAMKANLGNVTGTDDEPPIPTLVFYSATDKSPEAQKVLLNHPLQPRHVFRDVLDRVHPSDLVALEVISDKHLRKYHALRDEFKAEVKAEGKNAAHQKEFKKLRDALAKDMVAELVDTLQETEFLESAWCVKHSQMCMVSPRSCRRMAPWAWMEGAGTTCCPFSKLQRNGDLWLSPETLPTLVWAFSELFYGPDIICHECVPGFTEEVLHGILKPGSLAQGAPLPTEAPRCVYTAPDDPPGPRSYTTTTITWSAQLLGLPVERIRKYSWFVGRRFHLEGNPEFRPTVENVDCNDRVDGSVYFAAPDAMIDTYLQTCIAEAARNNPHLLDSKEGPLTFEDIMSNGDFGRLEGYRHMCRANACQDAYGRWHVPMALAWLEQDCSFNKRINTHRMCTLVRRCALYDLVRRRPLLPAEHWLVHGFGHPGMEFLPQHLRDKFPRGTIINEIPDRVQKQLVGNSMHLAVVPAWVGFWLLRTHPNLPEPVPAPSSSSEAPATPPIVRALDSQPTED